MLKCFNSSIFLSSLSPLSLARIVNVKKNPRSSTNRNKTILKLTYFKVFVSLINVKRIVSYFKIVRM